MTASAPAATHAPWRSPPLGPLALWGVLFLWCLRPAWGIDVFFHVVVGRIVLDDGIPVRDVLSAAHPDAPWTPFQVGYEVLVALVDRVGGLDALRGLHAAVYATGVALTALRARDATRSRIAPLLGTLLLLVLLEPRLRMRPHAFNLLLEAGVLLPLASGAWRRAPRRWLWGLGAAGFGWGLLHAMGALWLVAVAGTVVVLGRGRRERLWGAGAVAASLGGLLLAPGAAGGVVHVVRIAGGWGRWVPELAPSWAWLERGSAFGVVYGLLPWLGVASVGLAIRSRPDPARRATVLAAAGLALGGVAMARLAYYAVFAMVLVAPELAALRTRLRPLAGPRLQAGVAAALALLLVLRVGPRWGEAFPWTTTLQPGLFPVREARVLDRAGIEGGIFNASEWGGYLLYVLWPDGRVLSDGRIAFRPDVAQLLRADEERARRPAVAEAAWRRYGIDLLVRRRGAFPGHPEWKLLLRGPVAEVWSRRGPVTERREEAIGRVLERHDERDLATP